MKLSVQGVALEEIRFAWQLPTRLQLANGLEATNSYGKLVAG